MVPDKPPFFPASPPSSSGRQPAPHVQKAVAASLQAKLQAPAPHSRPAAHVQAAISGAQARRPEPIVLQPGMPARPAAGKSNLPATIPRPVSPVPVAARPANPPAPAGQPFVLETLAVVGGLALAGWVGKKVYDKWYKPNSSSGSARAAYD